VDLALEKHFWIFVAEYYNVKISKIQLDAYSEDVKGIGPNELKYAFECYRKDPKHEFMPRPAQILKYIYPEVSNESTAIDVASRISHAIATIGYNHPKEAEEYMGEIAWLVVAREGGWEEVCRNSFVKDLGTRFSQRRESAKSIMERSSLGILHKAPALPLPRKALSLGQIMVEVVKNLEGGEG